MTPSTDSQRLTRGIAVLWAGFLTACVAALLFFACFDPLQLVDDAGWPPWLGERRTGYAMGFFFFWAIGALGGALSTWLIRPATTREPS